MIYKYTHDASKANLNQCALKPPCRKSYRKKYEVLNELLHVQMIQINHDHFDECAVDDDADIIGVCQPAWLLHL